MHAAPDTYEEDVRAVLTKVQLGEVDAALVYVTDVAAAGDDVEGIDFPEAERGGQRATRSRVLADAPNPEAAQAFVDLRALRRGAAGARRRRASEPAP